MPHATLATRSFLTLGGGEMISRLIGFAATIYIARQLGADAYGIVGFAFAATLYLAILADGGMEQLGPREVAAGGPDVGRLVSSVLTARVLVSLVFAAGLAGLSPLLLAGPDGTVLAAYGVTLLAAGLNGRWALMGLDRAGTVAWARILAETVKLAVILIGVRGPEDILLVPLAQFAGDGLAAILIAVALSRAGIELRPRLDRDILRSIFRSARPLILTSVLAMIIYNSDVLLLRAIRDTSEVGLYLAAYTLINFLGVLGITATVSLIPSLSRLHGDRDRGAALLQTGMARVVALGAPLAVGGSLLAGPLIDVVFGEAFAASGPMLAILIWSIPLLLIRSVFQAALIAGGQQRNVLHATIAAAAVNVALNLALIPWIGPLGAAAATVAAELVRMVAAARFVQAAGLRNPAPAAYWPPIAAAALMGATLAVAPPLPLALLIGAAGLLYLMLFVVLGGRAAIGAGAGATLG